MRAAPVLCGLPPEFARHGLVVAGVPVWECEDGKVCAHTHDPAGAVAAAVGYAQERGWGGHTTTAAELFGSGWAVVGSGWCRLVTECGCTSEGHATHARGRGEWDCDRVCRLGGVLPPCGAVALEPAAWVLDPAPGGVPDALPYSVLEYRGGER